MKPIFLTMAILFVASCKKAENRPVTQRTNCFPLDTITSKTKSHEISDTITTSH